MTSELDGGLLTSRDAQPVRITNPDGRSLFLLIGDHAGNLVPERLCGLGLGQGDRDRHIAWDIGIAQLGASLAAVLDATFIEQRYSRLVVDCNRVPGSAESIVRVSDGSVIPGNAELSSEDRRRRHEEIFEPYHAAIAGALAKRDAEAMPAILVSLHSFTPRLQDIDRRWELGVLHDGGDAAFARRVLGALRSSARFVIGDNEPYRMDDTDYTIPHHAYAARRAYVEFEVRQDRLADPAAQSEIVSELAAVLQSAAA